MIFVTVGTDTPFDRMMRAVDAWAMDGGRKDLLAQTGEGGWHPRWMPHTERLSSTEYKQVMAKASLVVSHAGMGTILTALGEGVPLIVLPKRACFGEHRNDHQLHTARRLSAMGLVRAANDETELIRLLDHVETRCRMPRIGKHASRELLEAVGGFIHE